jgi:hypothetical protein
MRQLRPVTFTDSARRWALLAALALCAALPARADVHWRERCEALVVRRYDALRQVLEDEGGFDPLLPTPGEGGLDEHAWIDELLSLIDRLASGEVLDDEDPTAAPAPLGWHERIDIIAALPGMLADLHQHRIAVLTPRVPLRRADAPERNAPCPCGSGRKFKKCCGA